MKIVTASNGKKTVRMSKKEWESLGKKAGWMKVSEIINPNAFDFDALDEMDKEKERSYQDFRTQKGLNGDPRWTSDSVTDLLRKRLNRVIEKQVNDFDGISYQEDPIWKELNDLRERLDLIDKDISKKGHIDTHISSRIRSLKGELEDVVTKARRIKHSL